MDSSDYIEDLFEQIRNSSFDKLNQDVALPSIRMQNALRQELEPYGVSLEDVLYMRVPYTREMIHSTLPASERMSIHRLMQQREDITQALDKALEVSTAEAYFVDTRIAYYLRLLHTGVAVLDGNDNVDPEHIQELQKAYSALGIGPFEGKEAARLMESMVKDAVSEVLGSGLGR